MDTFTFTYIFRNITGVSHEYAESAWFCLTDNDKCHPQRAALKEGRSFIRRKVLDTPRVIAYT